MKGRRIRVDPYTFEGQTVVMKTEVPKLLCNAQIGGKDYDLYERGKLGDLFANGQDGLYLDVSEETHKQLDEAFKEIRKAISLPFLTMVRRITDAEEIELKPVESPAAPAGPEKTPSK